MEKHAIDSHKGEERPKYAMRIVKKYGTAFRRQIGEACRIRVMATQAGVTVLNVKLEYSRCELPKLVMEKGSGRGAKLSKAPANASVPQSSVKHATFQTESLGVVPKATNGNCTHNNNNRSFKFRRRQLDI